MKFGILGTGMVGSTIGTKLVTLGHSVMMGARSADNEKAAAWARSAGAGASHGVFADAAHFGDVVFNCTLGVAAIDALTLAGEANLAGKVLIDVSNPLDLSKGMPPPLAVCNDDSLGERIQRAFPGAKVVKTLNTMYCQVMVEPGRLPGEHDVFMSGNDPAAKALVTDILMNGFGWKRVIDLGDITTARGTEMLLPIWLRLWGALGTAEFNFHIVK